MIATASHTCHCGKTWQGPSYVSPPPSWEWWGGSLFCDDCVAARQQDCSVATRATRSPTTDAESHTSILLRSGSYLDLADPDCSVIRPIDIAAGLRQARFSAQSEGFYTIAQHSLLVLTLAAPAARKLSGDNARDLRRCALMHDAAEAFIHDITRPLKHQLPDYRRIEARLESRLSERFKWGWTQFRRETVKRADIIALAIEQRDLMQNSDPWPILNSIDLADAGCLKITRCWHPDEAMERFLTAFAELYPSTGEK